MVLWLCIFFAGLVGLVLPWRLSASIGLLVVSLVLLGLALFYGPRYLAAYLPPIAVVSALAGLLVWQRHRLPRWPFAPDSLAAGRASLRGSCLA